MRLKASLLATASGMTLVLIVVGLLHSTSHQTTDAEPMTDALSLVSPLLQPSLAPTQPPNAVAESVDTLLNRPARSNADPNETLNRRFSIDKSLDRVRQLEQMLPYFRKAPITHQAQPGKDPIPTHNRSQLETQKHVHSWAGAVAGTLKKQDYEIKKLELALAQKQFKDGEIPKTTLVQKQANYQKAAREFQTFLNSFRMAD